MSTTSNNEIIQKLKQGLQVHINLLRHEEQNSANCIIDVEPVKKKGMLNVWIKSKQKETKYGDQTVRRSVLSNEAILSEKKHCTEYLKSLGITSTPSKDSDYEFRIKLTELSTINMEKIEEGIKKDLSKPP